MHVEDDGIPEEVPFSWSLRRVHLSDMALVNPDGELNVMNKLSANKAFTVKMTHSPLDT